MIYRVEYTGFCIQGLVRKNNEDNIWCRDHCMPILHADEIKSLRGEFFSDKKSAFAVFDGMGGEEYGEIASYIAAKKFGELYAEAVNNEQYDERIICHEINRNIIEFVHKNRLRSMGATVVGLLFGKKQIRGFNLGDSRCYMYSEKKLRILSDDHVAVSVHSGKTMLTQCLGIPESEFLLEPKIFAMDYMDGDSYLLCSDGVSGVIGDKKIEEILNEKTTTDEKSEKIKDMVLKKGAPDNASAIVFTINACGRIRKIFWHISKFFSN